MQYMCTGTGQCLCSRVNVGRNNVCHPMKEGNTCATSASFYSPMPITSLQYVFGHHMQTCLPCTADLTSQPDKPPTDFSEHLPVLSQPLPANKQPLDISHNTLGNESSPSGHHTLDTPWCVHALQSPQRCDCHDDHSL